MEPPKEVPRPSNVLENRNEHLHSLFPAPFPQKSAHGNPDTTHLRGPEYPWARHGHDHGRTALPKDKNKEGAGHRLLNMLRKTLKGTESEELEITPEKPTLVPFGDVVGCLAIHIKNCKQFMSRISSQHYTNLFICISINNVVKSTKLCSLITRSNKKLNVISFDEVKYFSVQVPRHQDDERNNIYLDLMQHDATEKYPLFLGRCELHLYEVIQKGCFTEELLMMNKNTFICRVEAEFMFSYGNFGYGFSHQLKPLQKIVEPSMFMQVAPPPERKDPVTNVILPQAVEYPAFLSPDLNVTVGVPNMGPQQSQASVVRLEKLQQQPRERLEKMKTEYRNLGTWIEKVGYLNKIINPKLEIKYPKESTVSKPLQDNNPSEEKSKNAAVLAHVPPENKGATTLKLPDNDAEAFAMPTLSQPYQDIAIDVSSASYDPYLSMDTPFFTDPSLRIAEDKTQPLPEFHSEDAPGGKMERLSFPPEVKFGDETPRILKTDSSPAENNSEKENIKFPYFQDVMSRDTKTHQSTDKNVDQVVFSSDVFKSASFIPSHSESIPNYRILFLQFQKFHLGRFDPFLRNINDSMSDSIKKDKEIYEVKNSLSTEVIEHEDQDPPYPTYSKAAEPTMKPCSDPNDKLAHDPTVNSIKTLDNKNRLAHNPGLIRMKTLDNKNKPKETLLNGSLPNFKRESSFIQNINKCHLSKSLSPTSHIENLRQSMALKSVLSKNLQDLSDKLFANLEVPVNSEATKKSDSPHLSIPNEPAKSVGDRVFEKIQDSHSWLSEKDVSKSKSLLSQVIKNVPTDFLSGSGAGKSSEVAESMSEKFSEADETDSPMNKKCRFKKKHLINKTSSCKSTLVGSVPDCVIKQIFMAPLSHLKLGVSESSEPQMHLQDELSTPWGKSLSSRVLFHFGEENDETELPQSKSVVSQIIQAFPVETLLEYGLIKVIELEKECQNGSLLGTETGLPEEPKHPTEDYPEVKSKPELLTRQNTPTHPHDAAVFFGGVEFIEEGQKKSPPHSAHDWIPEKKPVSPSNGHRLDIKEHDLNSVLETFSNSFLMGKLDESDVGMLKSFLRSILKAFFTHNQSQRRRQPEKELEQLIQRDIPNHTDRLEEIQGSLNNVDTLHRKPILSPKLRVFLEELSESEVKNLKSELSKHIQHYLVERLSEAGHIAKEDLPTIYQNLHLMNEKADLNGHNIFQEKYSEAVREIMSFVNNFNHHFIDKHLEIKLRSFLNEILQNYFLRNLSESSLFNEAEPETIHSNVSSLRTRNTSISYHELREELASGSFGRRPEIKMKYPLNKSLQNYLLALSENELVSLKAELSKHLQSLFIEKLSKAGLMTERQLEHISHHLHLLNSSCTPLKCIKSNLPIRDEHHLMEEHSEKESKYSKTVPKSTLQKAPKDQCVETELVKREEGGYFCLQSLQKNPTIMEQNSCYPRAEGKTPDLIKIQPSSNKNTQAIPLNKSSERLTDMLFKKPREECGFEQFPRADNSFCKTESQDSNGWTGKCKMTQPKACLDRKMKVLGKKEHVNIYKLTVQERPEAVLSPHPSIPNCKIPREDDRQSHRFPFPLWQTNTLGYCNSEAGEKPYQEEQYCQRLKGNNNNNKKHLVTFAQYNKDIQSLYLNSGFLFSEKYARIPQSQLFMIIEDKKNSNSSFFPEVLKRENLKPKVPKETDHPKTKKPFNRIGRLVPTTLPTTRIHLKKSVPRTVLHWTARRTIHDCSDKFEDLPVTSFKHLTKAKSRARLSGNSPDDSHNQIKHSARPYTAPEQSKRQENYPARFTSPRMVSTGLVRINDTTLDYEIRKLQPPKKLKEDIEKCSLICDIIQVLNNSK
ncbi:uncharacterized protein LOC121159367 [Ochotona curzoniae]|uniref:uncharacterized protein LOC121159367 n=1 Tax=Ochotona curzoniae TaxID=130825 RepID=UPI001B34DE27|nr:uncharacterized protein LOC121159367 [Ochotona curzoniae]